MEREDLVLESKLQRTKIRVHQHLHTTVTKADMEKLLEKAANTAPAQTIRIEQAPMVLAPTPLQLRKIMEKKEVKWSKLFALGLGGVVGLSHLGMIGTLMNRESKLPSINVPVGPYTAYEFEVGKEGYRIKYRANDPLVMHVERDSNTKGGFSWIG